MPLNLAAQRLADGGLVALPTETVYGLGARADDDDAVARIFAAKGRPSNHPLIVHVPNVHAAMCFASATIPPAAKRLMEAFWPGPLTVIVPRHPGALCRCRGQHSLACAARITPVAFALLDAAGKLGVTGVAAPSANPFWSCQPDACRARRQ